jgi:hypothetical protein
MYYHPHNQGYFFPNQEIPTQDPRQFQVPGGGFPGGGFPGGGGGQTDRRLDRLERQIQRIDQRLDQLDRRVDRIERRLNIRDEF